MKTTDRIKRSKGLKEKERRLASAEGRLTSGAKSRKLEATTDEDGNTIFRRNDGKEFRAIPKVYKGNQITYDLEVASEEGWKPLREITSVGGEFMMDKPKKKMAKGSMRWTDDQGVDHAVRADGSPIRLPVQDENMIPQPIPPDVEKTLAPPGLTAADMARNVDSAYDATGYIGDRAPEPVKVPENYSSLDPSANIDPRDIDRMTGLTWGRSGDYKGSPLDTENLVGQERPRGPYEKQGLLPGEDTVDYWDMPYIPNENTRKLEPPRLHWNDVEEDPEDGIDWSKLPPEWLKEWWNEYQTTAEESAF